MEKFSIFGLNIINADSEELINLTFENLRNGKKTHIVTLNSLMVLRTIFSRKFKNIIKNAQIVYVESIGVQIACKMLGIKLKNRICGIDFFRELLHYIEIYNKSIYLLGGSLDTITKVEKNIKVAFPSVRIVGRYYGYFNKEEEDKIVIAIQKASPDFLFVALGSPKQEYWISKNFEKIKIAMGVGGSFDIFSGKKKRAPKIFINNGFEWLYRILTDPVRIFQIFSLFLFSLITIFYSFFKKIKKLFTKN